MLLYNRRYFLTSLLAPSLFLGACGFTPIYGPGGMAKTLRGAVRVAAPENREAYVLVKRLEEKLGQPANAGFKLAYEIETTTRNSGVTAAHEITRTQVLGSLAFTLTNRATGNEVQSGSVTSFTSFSNLGSTVSTASVERDAYRRLMVALADLLFTRLVATAPEWLA